MNRLCFKCVPLELLEKSPSTLILEPSVGETPIDFSTSIDVEIKYSTRRFPNSYPSHSERVFYIIHYPPSVFKVGSSTIHNITNRVYSQAPYAGIVSLAVLLKHTLSLEKMEEIEERCAKYLNEVFKDRIRASGMDRFINVCHRRERSFSEIFENYLMSLIDMRFHENNLYNSLTEISNSLVEHVTSNYRELMEPLYPPNMYMFRTVIDSEGLKILNEALHSNQHVVANLNDLRIECGKKPCKGSLVVLRNGVCVIRLRIMNSEKYFITPCDKVQHNLLIKIKGVMR